MGLELEHRRDGSIDIVRGAAIVTMVAANLAGPLLAEPHPLWLRFYGTFAAPVFIAVVGMMVARGARKDRPLGYYLRRGLMVVLCGVLIDLAIWKIVPFTTVDVLYLIGVSIPLACLFLRIRLVWLQAVLLAAVFLLTPWLQQWLGYVEYPHEWTLDGQVSLVADGWIATAAEHPAVGVPLWHHWVVDGWFPLFPWLGFALLGAWLGEQRFGPSPWRPGRLTLLGGGLLLLGLGGYSITGPPMNSRVGYSEMFYPPTLWYIAAAIGVLFLLLALVDARPTLPVYRPLAVFGQAAMLMYILHQALGHYAFEPAVHALAGSETARLALGPFLGLYLGTLLSLYPIAYGVGYWKRIRPPRSFLLCLLLGSPQSVRQTVPVDD